jgi:hypothetical protein
MIVSVHQPNYIPYPAYFAKIMLSDVFVVYDTAQFTRGDYFNRNRIRTFQNNGSMWLMLPVGKKDFRGIPVKNVKISNQEIFLNHGRILASFYKKSEFLDWKLLGNIMTPHDNLADHNIYLLNYILSKLKIKTRVLFSSKLNVEIGNSTQGLIDITKAVGGNCYIAGIGAKAYLQKNLFSKANVRIGMIDYKPFQYSQIHKGFVENMSIVDMAFNVGWRDCRKKLSTVNFKYLDETVMGDVE